jgi:methylisocitrate lyase
VRSIVHPGEDSRTDFRALLDEADVTVAPGAWDGLSARLIERAGFSAVCSSGYAVSASLGMPDIELYTATENLAAIRRIREACGLPLIADIDTGYGNAVNVMRTVSAAEAAGATAVFMEDQLSPKRCPICVGDPVDLLTLDEGVGKIRAAAAAKRPRTLLVARTDAAGDEAVRRLQAYRDAGADLLMPVTKTFASVEEWMACSERVGGGLVATLTAGTWVEREFTIDVMRDLGVRIALLPNQAIHAAAKAIEDALTRLHDGTPPAEVAADAMPHGDFIQMLGFQAALDQQARYMPASIS